jgi:hypothetical protein
VTPQRRTFANRHELRRLEVGVAQAGQSLPLPGKGRQCVDCCNRLVADERKGLTHQDQVGVVGHEAARRPQVDDRTSDRGCVAQGVDVRHHVVPKSLFVGVRQVEIDGVQLAAQGRDLFRGDMQAQGLLRLGQGNPQPPPCRELGLRRPEPRHLPARVASDQRIVVDVVRGHGLSTPSRSHLNRSAAEKEGQVVGLRDY